MSEAVATMGVAAFLVGAIFAAWGMERHYRRRAAMPPGVTIPELTPGFDLGKLYDLRLSTGDFDTRVPERLVGVRIVGFVGREDGQIWGGAFPQGRWLVIEYVDGRRGYVRPRAVQSLHESAPPA